jgi:choline dehydrogenase-like flavoprotein
MRNYIRHVNFGALVGSQPGGTVERKADILNGRAISWRLLPADVEHLKYALRTLAALAHHGGARRITLRTEPGISFEPTVGNCERFGGALEHYALGLSDLALVTAHPQGGNRMAASGSPEADSAVVDEGFLVRGWKNVYVADASLFPTGITVNPQWTIMALASMAARCVLRDQDAARSVAAVVASSQRAAE